MIQKSGERGSAVVDFILVSIPLLAVFFWTLSVTQTAYLRNVLLDAAVEGSRSAALADGTEAGAVLKTKQVLNLALGGDLNAEVLAGFEQHGTLRVSRVEIIAQVPMAGLLPINSTIRVVADASNELQ